MLNVDDNRKEVFLRTIYFERAQEKGSELIVMSLVARFSERFVNGFLSCVVVSVLRINKYCHNCVSQDDT